MKINKLKIFVIAIALQILFLAGMYLNSVYPIWIGEELILDIRPIDPRSLFRGNFARLDYSISSFRDINALQDNECSNPKCRWKKGEVIFVSLKKNNDRWLAAKISRSKPDNGLFIRGRVKNYPLHNGHKRIDVNYGIEAYFTTKEKALELENKTLRWRNRRLYNAKAKVMVAFNGKATLVDVMIDKINPDI